MQQHKTLAELRNKYHHLRSKTTEGTPENSGLTIIVIALDNSRTLEEARECVAAGLDPENNHRDVARSLYKGFLSETDYVGEKERALATLREILHNGQTITVMKKFVGKEKHRYSVLVVHEGEVYILDALIARAGIFAYEDKKLPRGLVVGGQHSYVTTAIRIAVFDNPQALSTREEW